jgi:hypothetical protein
MTDDVLPRHANAKKKTHKERSLILFIFGRAASLMYYVSESYIVDDL